MQTESFIAGKDASLESPIATMLAKLEELDFHVEERSWPNPVAGISEIYPLDDLEWENNSVGNLIRADILHLPKLDDEQCAMLLETLNELGLAADADSFWSDLRMGELKLLLALAIGDQDAIREGCQWVRH